MKDVRNEGECELCSRAEVLHRHHIIPRVIWRRLKRRGKVEGNPSLAMLCLLCSRQVHALFDERELAQFGSIEKLREHPAIKEYVSWVRRFGAGSCKAPPTRTLRAPRLSRRVKELRP